MDTTSTEAARPVSDPKDFVIETHGIDHIPAEARHGTPRSLFFIWFAANMQITAIETGALAVVPGFSLVWAIVSVIIGTLIGTVFMAYHSAQGPHLGLPQMIQSRAQFGYVGAILPLLLAVAMYFGFFATGAVLGAQALHALITGISISAGIIVLSILNMLIALFGYNLIHRFQEFVSYAFAVVFLVFVGVMLFGHPFPHPAALGTKFLFGPFLFGIGTTAIFQITYAPYVSDYSRYLPEDTSISSTFWYTYLGSAVSGLWMFILGIVIIAQNPSLGTIDLLSNGSAYVGGWYKDIMLIVIALGIVGINGLNIYGGFMTTLTVVNTAFANLRSSLPVRIAFIIPVTIIVTWLAFLEKGNLLSSYENFLFFLLYFMIPWTAINLTDYYLLRHGRYNITAIFNPNGIYGLVNWIGILSYAVGFVAEIPFMNSTFYEGPVAKSLDGGDISWVIGLIVAGVVYYFLMRPRVREQETSGEGITTGAINQ